jgi:hypothetical protein
MKTAIRLLPDAVGPRMAIPGFSFDTRLSKLEVIADTGDEQKHQSHNDDSE